MIVDPYELVRGRDLCASMSVSKASQSDRCMLKLSLLRFRLRYRSDVLAYCSALCFLFLYFSQIFLRFLLQQISTVLKQQIFGTNTKTKNFGTGIILQMKTLPPTASSLHSGDGITTAYIQREERENAPCWIHLLHELLQTSTKDCGS